VRDRLRSEERHLVAVRERLVLQTRYLLDAATTSLATTRQLLSAYDPDRLLAQGWAIVTRADGSTVSKISNVAVGERVRVRLSDGNFDATISTKNGEI